jgi:hypothetical protein
MLDMAAMASLPLSALPASPLGLGSQHEKKRSLAGKLFLVIADVFDKPPAHRVALSPSPHAR